MKIAIGILIPFVCTTLGSAVVFFVKEKVNDRMVRFFLAFAAGIMVAASIFSLLLPALEAAEALQLVPWVVVCISFLMGGLFLLVIDKVVPHFHPQQNVTEGVKVQLKKTTMMFLAMTLHNIPEGMAIGLMFGMAYENSNVALLSTAFALSIGMGIQNIPEGAAVSLPMKKEGISNTKAFLYGLFSGLVEPISALIAMYFVYVVDGLMPWLLAFAAGSMMYVVVEELIPESHVNEHSNRESMIFMVGFTLMMLLDIALG